MTAIPLFVELCAGLASVSGCLQHGAKWKPPVSRMGRKTGYAEAILDVMGLRPGQGARGYVWAEADSDVAALLAAYTQPEVMREIASIIRSWIPCPYGPHAPDPSCSRCKGTGRWDARDLWEVLRREKRRGLWEGGGTAGEVAGWAAKMAWDRPGQDAFSDAAGGLLDSALWRGTPLDATARRFTALPWPPVLIAQEARVSPGEVAGWANEMAWSKNNERGGMYMGPDRPSTCHAPGWVASITADGLARRFAACRVWPPVTLTPDAAIQPAHIPPETVVYMDPPYSDVAAVIPPMLAAERLPLGRVGRAEGDAALFAAGLDGLRQAVARLRVSVAEMLRAVGVQAEVFDSVVERVVIDVVDDLVWSKWAAEMALHNKAMFANVSPMITDDAIPSLRPTLALAGASKGGQALDLRRHLRDFAIRSDLFSSSAPEFAQAEAWADVAATIRRPMATDEDGAADLAGDIERHCELRCRVRQDINTSIARAPRKTTGYKHDLPRAAVVEIAQRWLDAGARVYISEAEPIAIPGWHHVEITGERRGQARTFGATREWLTCSDPPRRRQRSLFG